MLYGIGVIVVVAFIGLIVFNMRAGRTAKTVTKPDQSAAVKPDREPAVPRPEVHMTEAPHAADAQAAADDPPPPSARREEPKRGAAALRKIPTTSKNWEQSDDEYRQALRSFSDQASRTAGDGKEGDSVAPGKDEAYREGLRSLTKHE